MPAVLRLAPGYYLPAPRCDRSKFGFRSSPELAYPAAWQAAAAAPAMVFAAPVARSKPTLSLPGWGRRVAPVDARSLMVLALQRELAAWAAGS